MRSLSRLAPAFRQPRLNVLRSGYPPLTFAYQAGIQRASLGASRLRSYAESAALVEASRSRDVSVVNSRHQGEPSTAQLAMLVEDIKEVVKEDVGGNDAWARTLDKVLLDLETPRRKRIGGKRVTA